LIESHRTGNFGIALFGGPARSTTGQRNETWQPLDSLHFTARLQLSHVWLWDPSSMPPNGLDIDASGRPWVEKAILGARLRDKDTGSPVIK